MPTPNNGLIKETNRQYYEGAQSFICDGFQNSWETTFNTNLVFYSYDPNNVNYALNNFKLYTNSTSSPDVFEEYITYFEVNNNVITLPFAPFQGVQVVVQLKVLNGGN
jgi:hypothetical protein